MSLEDLQEKLDSIKTVTWKRKVLREWVKVFTVDMKDLAREINPFKRSKAKPLYKVKVDKKRKNTVDIFGLHPNVYEDPMYTKIPKEGFVYGKGRNHIPVDKAKTKFRFVKKEQEHLFKIGKKIYGYQMEDYFTIRKRTYGFTDVEKGLYHPAYSIRSIPMMVADYPELEDVMRQSFETAYKRIKSKMKKVPVWD